jgi:hypothetical protein
LRLGGTPILSNSPLESTQRRAARRARVSLLRRAALRRIGLGLLLVWSAAGLAHDAATSFEGWRHRRQTFIAPVLWRFGTPQPDWLARCAAEADAAAVAGSRIVLLARKEDFFRGRWAAYFLPRHDVFTSRRDVPPGTDLVVGLNGATPAGWRPVGGNERCRLFRPEAR